MASLQAARPHVDGRPDGSEAILASTFECIMVHALAGSDWPELAKVVQTWQEHLTVAQGGAYALLPYWSYRAAGGANPDAAVPLCAHWLLGNLSARMLDDLQDQDKDDMPWSRWPPQRLLVVGLALLFAAERCLPLLETDAATLRDLQTQWAGAGLLASKHQQPLNTLDEATYVARIAGNTGLLFATACWGGARLATAEPEVGDALADYGMAVGMLIQLSNDMQGLRQDLRHGHWTLAPRHALTQSKHPHWPELESLQGRQDRQAGKRIIALCREMGSLAYVWHLARHYQQKALQALVSPPLTHTAALTTYARRFLPTNDET